MSSIPLAPSRSGRRLRVGLILPTIERGMDGASAGWHDLMTMARLAEAAGFDSLYLVDHFLIRRARVAEQFGEPVSAELAALPPAGVWDCWTLLPALAAVTSTINLGTMVTCTGYRNPAVLAKMVATFEKISDGRLVLGLGAGDYADEHRSFGVPFTQPISRFEEALQIIVPLLRQGEVDFEGTFYSARECEIRPPLRRPGGPPIMIGALGSGPRMSRLVATYADCVNHWIAFGESAPTAIPALRDTFDAACRRADRAPESLARTATARVNVLGRTLPAELIGSSPVQGSAEDIAETLLAFADEGLDEVQCWLSPATPAGIEALAEALVVLDKYGPTSPPA